MNPAGTDVDGTIRQLRIVVGAILGSLVMLAAIALFVRSQGGLNIAPGRQQLVLGAVGLMAVAFAMGYAMVARQIRAEAQAKATGAASADPAAAAIGPYRRLTIVRAGLTNGPAAMALLAYLAGASPLTLVIPAGGALLLLGQLPSRASLERFAESLRG